MIRSRRHLRRSAGKAPCVKVTQICAGRFHHFDLARQLTRHGVLDAFFSGYPASRLVAEGLQPQLTKPFPYVFMPYLGLLRLGRCGARLQQAMFWQAQETLDKFAAARLPHSDCLIAFSGCGLHAGRAAQEQGMRYVCDEAGAHIAYRDRVLTEEYRHYDAQFPGLHPRLLAKELEEYQAADIITVPSEFVAQTFVDMGVMRGKLRKVPYGVDLRRFSKVSDPPRATFEIAFVGEVSVRKGVRYLLEAFRRLKHPAKRLTVVGAVAPVVRNWLASNPPPDDVRFMGHVPQIRLKHILSRSHAMLMPSVEEGLALVQGQALACGCPVVATWNTGAADLFTDGQEGFIVPARDASAMADRLQQFADDPTLRADMSAAALRRVAELGGTDRYGDRMVAALKAASASF